MASFRIQRFQGRGLTLAADVGGDPSHPPVILLHGGGQTRHSWRGAAQALVERGYHVINLDARGHGDSDWTSAGSYDWGDFAADLGAVITTLTQPPALVGASLGGVTSLALVGEPDAPPVKALVLVDIVPRLEPGAAKVLEFMASRPDGFASLEEAAGAVAAYYPNRARPKSADGLMKNLRQRDDGRLYWHWDPKLVAFRDRIDPAQFENRLLTAARNVKLPTLLVRGLLSDVVSDDGVAQLRDHLPLLEVYNVAEAGHMVAGDKNDAFNAAVIAFLMRNMPA